MAEEQRPPEPGDPDPAAQALDAMQRAALDAIGAARTMLEAAEALVRDPVAVQAVVDTMAAFGRMASDALGRSMVPPRPERDETTNEHPGDAGFHRIDID